MHSLVALCLLAAVVLVAHAEEQRCALRCYAGTVEWSNDTKLDYSFSVLPCAPVTVVDATLTDDDDHVAQPVFGCQSSEHVVSVTLDHAHTHLEWRYQSDSTCEQVLSSLDTIPGVFLGTDHRQGDALAQRDGDSLESAQRLCERQCDVCVDSGVIATTGRAGAKSPCGEEGTDECDMHVQWHGDMCTGQVTSLEVYVGDDVVPLSAYQPDALVGAMLSCDNGQITVESQGLLLQYAAPAQHNADCGAILTRINPLATGPLVQAIVKLSDIEMWSARAGRTLAGTETRCAEMTAPMAPKRASSAEDGAPAPVTAQDEDRPSAESDIPPVRLPVHVFVNCSRRSEGQCCSVFGYRNPNAESLNVPPARPHNYFVPSPSTRSQISFFQANTTDPSAFAVTWDCPEYKRHKLRWVLDLPSETRDAWRRTADATRERNDCPDDVFEQFCVVSPQ